MEKKHNIDKFQGYPHYPDNQDIMRAKNNNGKESLDADNTPPPPFNDTTDDRDEEVSIQDSTDADLTPDDLFMLESGEQNMDTIDGRNLVFSSLDSVDEDGDALNVDGSMAKDVSGGDLDIPGADADDANELIGEEDEENNFYSLGGDLHESQEENKGD
jgi:hypothetical protein